MFMRMDYPVFTKMWTVCECLEFLEFFHCLTKEYLQTQFQEHKSNVEILKYAFNQLT